MSNVSNVQIPAQIVYHAREGTILIRRARDVGSSVLRGLITQRVKEHALHVNIHAKLVSLTHHACLAINLMKQTITHQLYSQFYTYTDVLRSVLLITIRVSIKLIIQLVRNVCFHVNSAL